MPDYNPLVPIATLIIFMTGMAASADLPAATEVMPPTANQLQQPPVDDPVAGETIPMRLIATAQPTDVAENHANRIEALVQEVLADEANLVLVDDNLGTTRKSYGHNKHLTIEPIRPRYTVRVSMDSPQSPTFGKGYIPVELTLVDTAGATVDAKNLRYRADDENRFRAELRSLLAKHLSLTDVPRSTTGSVLPRLKAWIKSSDDDEVRIGGKIAFYFQASTKGYVSLYHFASSGTVQRIYPTEQKPYNFVEAGTIYRYPQTGYLALQGPAGEETVKAVFTVLPSNTSRQQPGGLNYKQDPLQVIPTHYPILFANRDMTRFFALPRHLYAEAHIRYHLKPQP